MSNNVDLNKLRDLVITNQDNNNENPTERHNKVVVDRDGKIKLGESQGESDGTSEVPQETFASRLK